MKYLDHFEETRFKEKLLVEKVGVQTQSCSHDPYNLGIRHVALGPNLYFSADGTLDPDPTHYRGCAFTLPLKILNLIIWSVMVPSVVG